LIKHIKFLTINFQKVQKSPKRVLEAESISRFARKREPIGYIPDTPPDSAFQGLLPHARPLMAILVGGGENQEILFTFESKNF
jgi:hypothetical protein